MSSLDYLELCRLCLVKERVSVPIFEGEGDVRQIFLKIAACLPVKVNREDKLPKKICDDCVYKVELFYQFWNTTANAEKQLLQWLGEVNLEDKQGYVTNVVNPVGMKPDQNTKNRLDGSVMQQVDEQQNNMGIGMMDNMGLGLPMMMPNANQQQITSVPMDSSGNSAQTVQAVPGPSTQTVHSQIQQNQTSTTQQEEEEEESEEDENSDDECDGDEGLPVKEEGEEDPNRTIEPTTFVNVSLACDEAGPSGLQQQKIPEMPEMAIPQTPDGDPKSGSAITGRRLSSDSMSQSVPVLKHNISTAEDKSPVESKRQVGWSVELVTGLTENVLIKNEIMQKETKRKRRCIANRIRKKRATSDLKSEEDEESKSDTEPEYSSESEADPLERTLDKDEAERPKESKFEFRKCHLCPKLFKTKSLLEGHLITHSDNRPHECDICGKAFKRQNTLAVHKRIHTRERNFVCCVCGRAFVQGSQLATHQRRHFKKYTQHCKICNKGFFTNAELRGHMNVKHAAKEHVCTYCNKAFPNNHTLVRHLKIHDPNFKPASHQCELCGKIFAYKNSLMVHMKSHTGENKFDCHICGRSVSSKSSLQDHLRLHGGEKSLICDVCGKAFHKRTTLVVHKRTHTGERPYSCDMCGKSFTQHSTLVIHKRYHTGQRPYQCTLCTKSFVSKALLNTHSKIHSTMNELLVPQAI